MFTTTLKALAAAAVLIALPAAGRAQGPANPSPAKTVIELFTSQGCSSCPAADALLGRLIAERKDIIALTFPTDTWDYLGWKDTLSSPKFSKRQKVYAATFKDMIYTPQAVINGRVHLNGADETLMKRKIAALGPVKVPIHVSEEAGKLTIEAAAAAGGETAPHEGTLWLAVLSKSVTVPVTRGENSGKTLTYYNVVREITPVGMWNGKAMTAKFERASIAGSDTDSAVVLLQESHGGPIIGAAMLDHL
ncbi:MAG: DUF1223 domain-containing protein [Hyphomicrobiales bacterium]|nr:MAG: DUF1223 domain-containing protein [Hyphomicrobiales bacterium]